MSNEGFLMKNKRKLIFSIVTLCAVMVAFCILFDFRTLTFKDVNLENIMSSERAISSDDMSVHFINVGAADSAYVTCHGHNILIDSGDVSLSDQVLEYLQRKNVKSLDLIIVSHPHLDHIGGMPAVIRNVNVGRFIMPILPDDILPLTKTYTQMLACLCEKGISVETQVPGTSFSIGDVRCEIFAPLSNYEDVNDYSIVARLSYGSVRFLFTGDAQEKSENDILKQNYNISADVLKVGHHGSKTSTTDAFLSAVSPKYAVISSAPSKHGHPHKVIVNKLNKRNINVLRTDTNGTIVISTDGNKIQVNTET